jgi:hypothetical protein
MFPADQFSHKGTEKIFTEGIEDRKGSCLGVFRVPCSESGRVIRQGGEPVSGPFDGNSLLPYKNTRESFASAHPSGVPVRCSASFFVLDS